MSSSAPGSGAAGPLKMASKRFTSAAPSARKIPANGFCSAAAGGVAGVNGTCSGVPPPSLSGVGAARKMPSH
eukprot:9025708-Heterocapsa_arctica.AAC.1